MKINSKQRILWAYTKFLFVIESAYFVVSILFFSFEFNAYDDSVYSNRNVSNNKLSGFPPSFVGEYEQKEYRAFHRFS